MKVVKKVIEQYTGLCRHSAAKCNNEAEIEYKIHRAVTLGQVTEIRDGGNTLVVRYHDLDFTIKNNKIVNMWRNRKVNEIEIDENVKNQYDATVQKYIASAW